MIYFYNMKIYLSLMIKNNKFIRSTALLCVVLLSQNFAFSQTKTATLAINDQVTYQKITGFGAFVNSPQFAYGAMSEAEIRTVWGAASETNCNIMRIYIPTGSTTNPESSWSQALSTVQLAKSMGLTVFASPWTMPAAWKTNNSTTMGSLNTANYGDYADYLNRFVTYMRNNGADIDAISIQNEPDANVTYQSCTWTPAQITTFLQEYRSAIDCKIVAPEAMNIGNTSYLNAMAADDVVDQYDIYAGHQYGWNGSATSLAPIVNKGKEIWMTEYLLNWAPNGTTLANVAPFNWTIQAFDFAKAINDGLLAGENAWIHYSAKRYYGLIGDGYGGTTSGAITKRGYVLAQYAKYVTGATRIDNTWSDNSNTLYGSSYLSATGDSIMAVVINPSGSSYTLTVNLPFSVTTGTSIETTATANLAEAAINIDGETGSPQVAIDAYSVTTLIFSKSTTSIKQIKNMATVLSEEYYTLMGQKVLPEKNNLKGIYIVKSHLSDGSVSSRKIYFK